MPGQGNKKKLTEEYVKRLLPSDGKQVIWDTQTPGLNLQIQPSGTKTWYWLRWVTSMRKRQRNKIGRWPETKLRKAREMAETFNEAVRNRKNPRLYAFGRTTEDLVTLNAVWTKYRSEMEDEDGSVSNRVYIETLQYNRHVKPLLGEESVEAIATSEVAGVLAKITKGYKVDKREVGGKTAAIRVRALLSKLFNYGILHGFCGTNPVSGTRASKEIPRDRYILPEEMPKFLAAVDDYENQNISDAIHLLLFTGQRKGNVFAMRWEELDLDARVWTIPSTKTKSGREYRVPIVERALLILEQSRQSSESEWVFPSARSDGEKPMKDIRSHWSKILARSKLPGLRMHDLRRTVGTYLSEAGASYDVTVRILGHSDKNLGVTARYVQPSMDRMKTALEAAVFRMFQEETDAEIVAIG